MLNRKLILKIKQSLSKRPEILGTYVLGSAVSGNVHQESDFDLAVVVKNKEKISDNQVYDLLSHIQFPKDLDLSVIDKNSSPLFLFQAISKGQCVYFRSDEERVEFESFVAKNYYDTAHIRSIYYSALQEKFPYASR